MKAAERLNKVKFSPIRLILEEVRERQRRGEDICSFCAGEPDFNTPELIKKAVCEKLAKNNTHYSSNRGVLELRQAIAERVKADFGVTFNAETEILITTGGAEAIEHVMAAFINPGDEVIIFTPAFVNYSQAVYLFGGSVIEIPLTADTNYQLDIEKLERHITKKTKMVVINNPCNPTGAVYEKEDIEKLCKMAVEYNFLIFSDEIYGKLTYGENKFYSITEFEEVRKNAIIMNGFSKAYAMTGWRVGYLLADNEHIDSMLKVHQYTTTSGNTFVQEGVAQAMNLNETLEQTEIMRQKFEKRSQIMSYGMSLLESIEHTKPQGAFYIVGDVSGIGYTGSEFARALLEEEKVAVVPMIDFGQGCDNLVRFSFATKEETIEEGLRRMENFIKRRKS